jgi:Tfp pilus assembly protein PilV
MRKNSGLTIVELLIALPVIIVVMTVILVFILTLLNDFSSLRTRQTLSTAGQTALQQIESDVKLSSAFLTAVDTSSYTDNYGTAQTKTTGNNAASWSFTGSNANARTLILNTYATDKNPLDDTRSPVFINQVGCSSTQIYANDVLTNTVIYFIFNNTLYRRVLTQASPPATCSSPFQVQSCPAVSNRPANCIIDDTELLKNVSSFSISYYINSVSQSPIDAYSSPNANTLNNAMAVDITITTTQPATPPIINNVKLRVTRLN